MSKLDLQQFDVMLKKAMNVDHSKLPPKPANEYVNADGTLTERGCGFVRGEAMAARNEVALLLHDSNEDPDCRETVDGRIRACDSCTARGEILRAYNLLPDWTEYDAAFAKAMEEAPTTAPSLNGLRHHPFAKMLAKK